jgi:hypothetical protein
MKYPALAMVAVLALGACTGPREAPQLRNLSSMNNGPDEFLIVPGKPLEQPKDFAALPTPTPGGANLTDQNPVADAVAQLGGRPGAIAAQSVPAADTALVQTAARNGQEAGIRQTLASEDEDLRRRMGRFQKLRIFIKNKYNEVYSGQTLDAEATNQAFRRQGVPTPSVPSAGQNN